MSKLDKFIVLLQDVLSIIEQEKNNASGIWDRRVLDIVVRDEMSELLSYAQKGEIFFKYGKKQRMLGSTYWLTDNQNQFWNSQLGIKISEVQQLLNKL